MSSSEQEAACNGGRLIVPRCIPKYFLQSDCKVFPMRNPVNNQDLITKMNLLLDNELTPEAERAFLNEIKSNPSYREILSKERSFREFIKTRIQRKTVKPSLKHSILEKIKVSQL
jgi:hypothetical protein